MFSLRPVLSKSGLDTGLDELSELRAQANPASGAKQSWAEIRGQVFQKSPAVRARPRVQAERNQQKEPSTQLKINNMNKSPYACVATENPATFATRKLKRPNKSSILSECRDAARMISRDTEKPEIPNHPIKRRPGMLQLQV